MNGTTIIFILHFSKTELLFLAHSFNYFNLYLPNIYHSISISIGYKSNIINFIQKDNIFLQSEIYPIKTIVRKNKITEYIIL